jgi:hypothetical protein
MYHDRYLEIKVPANREEMCIEFLQKYKLVHGYDYSMFTKHEYTVFKFYVCKVYEQCYEVWRNFALVL